MPDPVARARPAWWLRAAIALLAVVLALAYLAAERRAGPLGFPLDDAWIHAQFATNLAHGHGLAFNPGEPSTGSTSPLWTALLAVPVALGLSVVAAAKTMGIVLAAVAAILAFELARLLSGSTAAGAVAGGAVACCARLTWGAVSGMEVPLAVVLVLLTLLVFVRDEGERGWLWGLLAGLATLARPETAVLFPVLAVVVLVSGSRLGWRARFRGVVASATWAFAATVAIDLAVNVIVSGRPLPETFYAKTAGAGLLNGIAHLDVAEIVRSATTRPLATLNAFIRFAVEQSALAFLFVLVGLLAAAGVLVRPRRPVGIAVPLFLLLSPIVVGAVAPIPHYFGQDGRYVAHLLALFFVLAAVGAADLAGRARHPSIVWGLAILAVARLLSQDVQYAPRYAAQVDNINRLHVAMGRWLAAHTAPADTVATNDIGAIGFFSGRRVIDLEGLVTPAVLPYRAERAYVPFVEHARPAWLVVFPEWYPELAARTDLFHEVSRITVPHVTAARDALVVYATPWTPPAEAATVGP
jgi:hypothetical protein